MKVWDVGQPGAKMPVAQLDCLVRWVGRGLHIQEAGPVDTWGGACRQGRGPAARGAGFIGHLGVGL